MNITKSTKLVLAVSESDAGGLLNNFCPNVSRSVLHVDAVLYKIKQQLQNKSYKSVWKYCLVQIGPNKEPPCHPQVKFVMILTECLVSDEKVMRGAALSGVFFFASWRLVFSLFLWISTIFLIVLVFKCLKSLALAIKDQG